MITNEQRSEREISEFLSHPPDEVFAYYSKDPAVGGHIGNWMGARMGTITWVGKVSRPMGGKVVSIRMKGINGLIYAGKCNLSSGTYCRLRRVAPKLYSERDVRRPRRDPDDQYRTHGKGKLRRELGVIGNAMWHLPKPSPFIIYWNGPGARLLFGTNRPGTSLDPIEFPGADGNYRTLKEATAAVARFWKP